MIEIGENSLLKHNKILGALFLIYGGLHALAFAFFLVIVLAVSVGGVYYRVLDKSGTLILLGVPACAALAALAAGYGLVRESQWAQGATIIGCCVAVLVALVILVLASQPHFTMNRVLVVVLYCSIGLLFCLYERWIWRKKGAV